MLSMCRLSSWMPCRTPRRISGGGWGAGREGGWGVRGWKAECRETKSLRALGSGNGCSKISLMRFNSLRSADCVSGLKTWCETKWQIFYTLIILNWYELYEIWSSQRFKQLNNKCYADTTNMNGHHSKNEEISHISYFICEMYGLYFWYWL